MNIISLRYPRHLLFLLLFGPSLFLFNTVAAQIKWPNNKKAAIVLTYDDGLQSHLDVALGQLQKHKFKGTFFLTGNIPERNIARWRSASKRGHELANHTLYHPCSRNAYSNRERLYSENYDVQAILDEIKMMNRFLFLIDGKQRPRSYAYPCTETKVGGTDYADSLRHYSLVASARVGGDSSSIITKALTDDTMLIPSYALSDGTKADAMIRYTKTVQASNGLGIFMFHGIGGDYITVSKEDHAELLRYLASNKDIWVTTFAEAVQFISR
ncbi:MAG: polysaccharide deacetylase family protein [Chryseolinea sp.]